MNDVLIADNDRAVSGLLTEVLERRGVRADHAFDGEAARRLARREGLAVLICDLDMPLASGIDVLESLSDLANPPAVVVISGYLDARVEQQLARLPFVREVLRKPFDLLRFAETVVSLVAAAQPAGCRPGNER